ncbi:MAG: MlaD family protein, partial [Thiotrichaceae bacterium]
MSESYNPFPKAEVESHSGFSLIWIIPLVAFLVGGWLVYKVYSEKGDIITVTFNNAEGIEVKKTPIRFKDVAVGKVIDIKLDPNLQKVQVTAEIEPFMAKHLGPETRFWTVRPRVSVQGISGLSTLLSGIYIGIDPGPKGKAKTVYQGLDTPPRVTSYVNGSTFTLQARKLGSLDIGSPVYYRQINV